jgi:hypothetical protein
MDRVTQQATQHAANRGFCVREFKPFEKNTLRGFLSLELPSGLILHDCTIHEKNGSRWVGLPAKQYEKNGEKTRASLVDFASREARNKFQEQALAGADSYLTEDATK